MTWQSKLICQFYCLFTSKLEIQNTKIEKAHNKSAVDEATSAEVWRCYWFERHWGEDRRRRRESGGEIAFLPSKSTDRYRLRCIESPNTGTGSLYTSHGRRKRRHCDENHRRTTNKFNAQYAQSTKYSHVNTHKHSDAHIHTEAATTTIGAGAQLLARLARPSGYKIRPQRLMVGVA